MSLRSDSLRFPDCLLQIHSFRRVQDIGMHNLQLVRRERLRFLQICLLLFPQMPGGRFTSPQKHLRQYRNCSRLPPQRLDILAFMLPEEAETPRPFWVMIVPIINLQPDCPELPHSEVAALATPNVFVELRITKDQGSDRNREFMPIT